MYKLDGHETEQNSFAKRGEGQAWNPMWQLEINSSGKLTFDLIMVLQVVPLNSYHSSDCLFGFRNWIARMHEKWVLSSPWRLHAILPMRGFDWTWILPKVYFFLPCRNSFWWKCQCLQPPMGRASLRGVRIRRNYRSINRSCWRRKRRRRIGKAIFTKIHQALVSTSEETKNNWTPLKVIFEWNLL